MCIVDRLTFHPCTHQTFIPLFPCNAQFSASLSACTAAHHIIRKYLSSTDTAHCRQCFQDTLVAIRTDHAKRYLDLEREARGLGWCGEDIQGSLMEMQAEMDATTKEWEISCNREGEGGEVKLGAFADSVRFHFGPTPVRGEGRVFEFRAGVERVFADAYVAKKAVRDAGKKKMMTRVRFLRAEKLYMDTIAGPWGRSG